MEPKFDFNDAKSPLAVFLMMLFAVLVIILLMNILIALMSDTFNRIQSNGTAQWKMERCKIILEQNHLATDALRGQLSAHYLNVLRRTEHVSSDDDKFHARINDIQKQVLMISELQKSQQKSLSEIEKHLSHGINIF
jgi:hypothetical protein